jgi:hypothetical protein
VNREAQSKARLIDDGEVNVVNYLNIALMFAAMIAATYAPFETFVIAYVVLGPLHYLTEIAWLHDRQYFSHSRNVALWLLVPATVLAYLLHVGSTPYSFEASVAVIGFMIVASAGLAFSRSRKGRSLTLALAVVFGVVAVNVQPIAILLAVFVPTFIHVYIFTGLFIVYGALKSRSFSGILSTLVFCACPFLCLYMLQTPTGYSTSPTLIEAMVPFDTVVSHAMRVAGLSQSPEGVLAFMRFMAFAYAYHYLNWFSKTRIINWHHSSRSRVWLIALIYIAAVAIYLIDFRVGFVVLLFLSFLHVVLEFPLNFRTAVGIASEIARKGR